MTTLWDTRDFTTGWNLTNANRASLVTNYDGAADAQQITEALVTGSHAMGREVTVAGGERLRLEAWVAQLSASRPVVLLNWSGNAAYAYMGIDGSGGVLATDKLARAANTALSGGWRHLLIELDNPYAGYASGEVWIGEALWSLNYLGETGHGIVIGRARMSRVEP